MCEELRGVSALACRTGSWDTGPHRGQGWGRGSGCPNSPISFPSGTPAQWQGSGGGLEAERTWRHSCVES